MLSISTKPLKKFPTPSDVKEKSIQEELAEDIISIIHSFSGKLYGMRNKIKEKLDKELSD